MRGLWDLEEDRQGVRMTSGADDVKRRRKGIPVCSETAVLRWSMDKELGCSPHQAIGAVSEQKQGRVR